MTMGIFTMDRATWGFPIEEYQTKRCVKCRWTFQCHRSRADRIYCRACESRETE